MSPQYREAARSTSTAVVSVYFADATAELRAQLALSPEHTEDIARQVSERNPDLECVIVATCNRTELVLGGRDTISSARAIGVLHEALGLSPNGSAAPCLAASAMATIHHGPAATEHLFRVTCGLESQMLGDNEILGQVRRAWRTAETAGQAGPLLRPLFRDAFAVGKRARSSTDIGAGGAGIGTAVLAAIGDRDGHAVVIGAGDAGRTIARRLGKQDRRVTIVNRTLARAEHLAEEIGGRAMAIDDLDLALADAEVVVNAIGSRLLTEARLTRIREQATGWNPLVLDVAATPSVDAVPGLEVIDLERLHRHGDATAARRAAAVSDVEALVAEAHRRHHRPTTSHHHVPAGSIPAPDRQGVTPCAY